MSKNPEGTRTLGICPDLLRAGFIVMNKSGKVHFGSVCTGSERPGCLIRREKGVFVLRKQAT